MKTSPEFVSALAHHLGRALLHSLWQGTAIAIILATALYLLRRRSAAVRHAVCFFALVAMLVTMVVTLSRPIIAAHSTSESSYRNTARSLSASVIRSEGALTPDNDGALKPSIPASARPVKPGVMLPSRLALLLSWCETRSPFLSVCWAVGVLALSLRHIGGWWWIRKMRRCGTPAHADLLQMMNRLQARFDLPHVTSLLVSVDAAAPMLVGLLKPVVLLPASVITGLDSAQLEAILAHEIAHLVRRDAWANLFQLTMETLFFYHPAIWWIGRRMREEREIAADDLALSICTDRRLYAGALARLVEVQQVTAFALAANGGSLLHRIRRIVHPAATEPVTAGWSSSLPVVIALAMIGTLWVTQVRANDENVIVLQRGELMQAAIDHAPAGSIIRIPEGEWKEHVVINKPLTLEGAGWEKTRLVIEEPPTAELTTAYSDVSKKSNAATTPEEKKAVTIEWIQRLVRPAVWVRDANDVKLRNLRIQGISHSGRETGGTRSALAYFHHSTATMEACAVIGPFGNGVEISAESDVEIRGSLVAAIWSEGITVEGPAAEGAKAGRLHLVDSEVRNVYHYGVYLGSGCDSTLIEHCRISGTAWHGIRYDNASPTIIDNVIFAHARSGIYASGQTKATVRGNLFWKNEMDGISCWLGGADVIEGNTFAGNLREGLAVIGGAKPAVTRNVFAENPVGVVCGVTSRRNGEPLPVGEPVLNGNLFWDNKTVLQVKGASLPVPAGNVESDPQFRDATKADFSLAANSPARAANAGVAEPPAPGSSPWRLLDEEKSIVPADDTREFRYWTAPGAAKLSNASQTPSPTSQTLPAK